jgi:tetratricopeptide (TPR) repeat protein
MVALWEEAMPFLAAAVRSYGAAVLAGAPDAEADTAAGVGRRLLWEVFGAQAAGGPLPEPVAALIASPDDADVRDALGDEVAGALHDDPSLKAVVIETLTGFYRREIEAGNTEAMVQLGDLRQTQDDLDGARAAYQRAIDCGNARAMLSLAHLLMGEIGDAEGARAWFQRAIDSGDADLAAETMVDLGHLLVIFERDAEAAQAAFRQAIDSGHPEWAPAGMVGLAHLLRKQGDAAGARASFEQAIESGNPSWAGHAMIGLGELLEEEGDAAGARAVYWRAVESRTSPWAAHAFTNLVNMLRWQDDADGLRAAHRRAVETANPDASYALAILGQILGERGDAEGARAVLQEAVAAGDEMAQEVLADMARKKKPERVPGWGDSEPADLPAEFDPRRMAETGIVVLEHGLPVLPEMLTHQMSVPIAYWKAERCAVVLFLAVPRFGEERGDPMVFMGMYSRDRDQWAAAPEPWLGTGFSSDPIARPGDLRDLDGRAIVTSGNCWSDRPTPGNPAMIVHGRVGPAVAQLALIQDGHEDRRRLKSHFGAWVVCTEQASPFQVAALDESGSVLGSIEESFPPR